MIPFLSRILSRLLIDRKDGHRRAVLAKYREFLRVSYLPAEEIKVYQNRQLAELLNHARVHVPFWKEAMKGLGEIRPENAREVYARLPLMERSAVQSDFDSFTWKGIEAMKDATGGSSGTPMNFLVDPDTHVCGEATMYWSNHLAGWRYGHRVAMLWGSDRDVGNAKKEPRYQWRCWFDNIRWYNSFDMGPDRMAEFHEDMCRFKPHVIVGYAGSLEVYARYLREKVAGCRLKVEGEEEGGPETRDLRLETGEEGVQCSEFGVREGKEDNVQLSAALRAMEGKRSIDGQSDLLSQSTKNQERITTNHDPSSPSTLNLEPLTLNYPLTALISSAEVLTPQARSIIESVFGKPVYDRYGNREGGAMAAKDGKGGLLVNSGAFMVDIDSPDPVRVPGPIIICYLWNKAMPFIRYNTGDLGLWVEGGEGRRIARIQGRQGDTIRTKGGKLIHGEYFTHLMYGAEGVKEFQFVQEKIDAFRLRVVSDVRDPVREEEWKRKVLIALGEPAEIVVEYVEEIPLLRSGKRKFTVSLV